MNCAERPPCHTTPQPASCAICYRAVNCGEWQAQWCLPVTAGPCNGDYGPWTVASAAPPLPPTGGPGTELKKLLAELGTADTGGCGCDSRAAQMDAWGVAGCRERSEEIVAWLREQFSKLGWAAKAKLAVRAVLRTVSSDPAAALVNEAIRRAEDEKVGVRRDDGAGAAGDHAPEDAG